LVHGVPKEASHGPLWELTTTEHYTGAPGTITRTLEHLDWPSGPHLLLLDYDPDPQAQAPVTSADELLDRLAAVWPAFRDAAYLITHSTSSAIKHKTTGAWLVPPYGMHCYPLVTGDVARFREALKVRLWLAGEGFCKLAHPNSHTGVAAMLERALVDLTVMSPERLDYVAGADIPRHALFVQVREAPVIHPGGILDLDTFPPLTAEERTAYDALVAEAKARLAPEQHATIRASIRSQHPTMDDAAVDAEIARRLERATRCELVVDHPLYFARTTCTAGTVTRAQDGKRLRDPQEPDYGPSQAVFHWNGGDWCIVSFAHGVKKVYRLAEGERRQTDTRATRKARRQTADNGPTRDGIPLSDYFNALALVDQCRTDVHYCYPWKSWLPWTGTHWQRDDTGTVMQWAKATIRGMLDTLKDLMDDTARDELYKHIKSSLSTSRLEGMVKLAQDEPGIPVLPDALDQHHWLLNCANGTLDLKTGTLRPHTRGDLLTKCLALAYDPEAPCPTWERFLWHIMGGSVEQDDPDESAAVHQARYEADERARRLIGFLQRAVGYSLTGDTSEHCFFLLYGTGRNGKGTFIETVQAMLGPYGKTAEMSTFLARQTETVRNDLADLHGARFVSASEADKGRRLAESLVKRLTGGDRIKARFLFQEYFEFLPQMHVWLAVNDKPIIRGTDLAMWERIRLIPFEVFLKPEERDKHLGEKLRAELPGILTWAVKGCLEWQRYDGLKEPDDVKQATAAYRKEMDTLGQFLDECCTRSAQVRVKASTLYKAYQEWCADNGYQADSMMEIGYRLEKMEVEKKKSNGWWYLGIGLNSVEEK
jgi:putative DNA primase/helicase